MTIKKQLIILTSIIVAIPILSLASILIQHYTKSPERFMLKGTNSIVTKNNNTPTVDQHELFKILRLLPYNVESIVISDQDNLVLFSQFESIKAGNLADDDLLWNYINQTSDIYLYQYSKTNIENTNVSIFSRTLKNKDNSKKMGSYLTQLLIFISIIVLISIIVIIIMSHTIFKSIVFIEDKTHQLAVGNLNIDIISTKNGEYVKKNEITSILNSLEQMRISLLEELNRKNLFIMGISHDLRTPVAVIKGYTEAISDGIITDKDEINTTIELIQNKTNQLANMVDTLISFMKLNNYEIRENLTENSITELITTFAKDSELTATVFKRNIKTSINLPQNIAVPLNKQLAMRSFENLFSNALRYTKDNDTIEIKSYIKDSNVILEVSDSGIGIEEKDLKHIFDLFYRGTNSRLEEGMGIGLAVVKNIMDTHGWDISVTSTKNHGSCFTITIPFITK